MFGGLTAKKQGIFISDLINEIDSSFDFKDQKCVAIK